MKPKSETQQVVWDTRTQKEVTVTYGFISPKLTPFSERVNLDDLTKRYSNTRTGNPIISISEINETQHLFKIFKETPKIPEINTLKLYPKHPETFMFKMGDCRKQRNVYPFVSYKYGTPKRKTRAIKKKHQTVLTLLNLNFNPKFNYSIAFKCPFCDNHQNMSIKTNHRQANKRKTPVCNKHHQEMYISKVTKKKPRRKHSYPKTIYEVLLND